jgi:hypothetical protein
MVNFTSSLAPLVEEHCATVPIRTNSPKNRETPGNLPPLKPFLVNLASITNCGLLDWLLNNAADISVWAPNNQFLEAWTARRPASDHFDCGLISGDCLHGLAGLPENPEWI